MPWCLPLTLSPLTITERAGSFQSPDCIKMSFQGKPQHRDDASCAWQVLLDRLAAQELMLLQRPVISGRYSGSPFVNMLSGPLDDALRPLFSTLVVMGELVQSILSEEPRSDRAQVSQLEEVIRDVEAHRYHHIVSDGVISVLEMHTFTGCYCFCCWSLHHPALCLSWSCK